MLNRLSHTLFNTRLLAILNLGFVSGLPLALTNTTLQAWFTQAGVNVVSIGALSLIGIPYTIKFLWAPLMDHYGLGTHGKRKSWLLLTQVFLIITLLILARMNPAYQSGWMSIVALSIAFFSASQDIAISAYQTDLLPAHERGLGVSYYVFMYRVALLVAGGGAFVIADYLGWSFTYQCMAVLIGISFLFTYLSPKPHESMRETSHFFATMQQAFLNLLRHERIIAVLFFILFYKFGDALALSLMSNFLLKTLGFSLTEVGLVSKTLGFIAMIAGGFVGGIFLLRSSIFYALLIFGLAQAFSNFLFIILALVGKQFFLMAVSLFVENFCSGLSTAALVAFLMSICDKRYTATQFALLSAISSVGRVFLGPVAGFLVAQFGYVEFYFIAFLLCFPGLMGLIFLKERVMHYEAIAAQ